MRDGQLAGIADQILGGCVRTSVRLVNQDVVPGLIASGLSLIIEVPGFVCLALRVALDDDAAVAIAPVADQLARLQIRRLPSGFGRLVVNRNHGGWNCFGWNRIGRRSAAEVSVLWEPNHIIAAVRVLL